MRRPIAELRTTLFAALAVGCGTAREESTPQVVIQPDPPTPTSVAPVPPPPTTKPPPSKLVGYEKVDGAVNRLGPATCSAEIPKPQCKGTETHQRCKTDADCTDHPHGRCKSGVGQIGSYCGCFYGCTADADCEAGQVCVCGDVVATHHGGSVCAPASCRGPGDCGGQACGVSSYDNGCGIDVRLACRKSDDACKSQADCSAPNDQCVATSEGFTCMGRNCVIGRPLRVAGELRAAAPARRSDWSAGFSLAVALTAEERQRARWHYLTIAALEHGSVGSFARFTLQLLALGAPARLLAEAQWAALDEVRHAELMYGIASTLGADVGPGAVDAADAPPTEPVAVLEALIEEGCVGETLGAAEAAAAARDAVPALARALREVAADETRHAQLAWDTVAWMLATWPSLRPAAETSFRRALARLPGAPSNEALPSLGILAGGEIEALRHEAVDEVVRPLAQHLLA